MEGWTCPKCGHCYSPFVTDCANCNRPEGERIKTSASGNVVVEEDKCPHCGNPRSWPGGAGCGMEHYGSYCQVGAIFGVPQLGSEDALQQTVKHLLIHEQIGF